MRLLSFLLIAVFMGLLRVTARQIAQLSDYALAKDVDMEMNGHMSLNSSLRLVRMLYLFCCLKQRETAGNGCVCVCVSVYVFV